ncbi:unnamed protein product [Adineta steineri]|uniref:Uncharacterized protein n=1 Tax=Adineta steineri TaxID=433720 RepID=A0A815RTP7_9BILA|nr:unnamed protein product [Adineta steineri]CAF4138926.1 unnamed protein product [Adineta steineri]
MASLMFGNNGQIQFQTRSNQYYKELTTATLKDIMPSFVNVIPSSAFSGIEIVRYAAQGLDAVKDALAPKVLGFVLQNDDNCTLSVADEKLCEAEQYHLLRIVGAHMDEFKNSPLKIYFDDDKHVFEKTIWSFGDLSTYVGNIVTFCASARGGHVNMSALTNILSTLLKTQISEERSSINKSETIIIYSERAKECGVIKLNFTGDQIKVKSCCSEGANTKINVEKDMIMFKDGRELLLSLRTFARENRR